MTTLLAHSRAWVDGKIAEGKTSATLTSDSCMVKGLSGLTAITTFGGWGCALVANGTLGIVAFSHAPAPVGSTGIFAGNLYRIEALARVPGTELWFGKLDFPVLNVNPIKVLPPSSTKYAGFMAGLPGFWIVHRLNRMLLYSLAALSFADSGHYLTYTELDDDADWTIGAMLGGGDSNSPLVTVANSTLVLLASAWYASAASAWGTSVTHYHAASESLWLSEWGITDAFTEIDLSTFDDAVADSPPHIPDPEASELEMAKTTNFTAAISGNLSTAGNWDNGLPVAGDTANIDATVDAGTMPAGVTVNNLPDGVIAGGTWLSSVNNTEEGAQIKRGTFKFGIVFPDSTVYGLANLPKNTMNFSLA